MSDLSVNTNPSSFVALETMNDTNTALAHVENTVSTGKKVATAADDPAAFGIDQEIGGQVAGQNAVNDGLSYAASLVNTSTSAANQIIDVLKNIRGTVTSSGDTIGEKDAEDDFNNQITGYLNQIDTISRAATSNGINILAGTTSNGFDISGTSLSYVTSFEGNTASIGNAFSMLESANVDKMDEDKARSNGKINYRAVFGRLTAPKAAKTLTAALGLTVNNEPNGQVKTNFLTKVLKGDINGPSPEGEMFHKGIAGDLLKSPTNMNLAISYVDNAIKGMQYITARLGNNSQTIQNLASFGTKLGDNLQDAQGSLVDADMSKESAKLNALQTKQQLDIKSLTIANGQSQTVLSLFQG